MSDDSECWSHCSEEIRTFPMQAGDLKKGTYVMIKGGPCKVVETDTGKTGKHGHAKIIYVGLDLFTGKKREDSNPTTHNVDCPEVSKVEYNLINYQSGMMTLMDNEGLFREDLDLNNCLIREKLERKLADGLAKGKEMMVTVIGACGKEAVISCRENAG
jgi:translation initiation factor 5A